MLWLIVALASYLLLATVNIVDKYLLKSRIPSPKIYAFYVGIFGMAVLVFVPFGLMEMASPLELALALSSGAFQVLAVFLLFKGLKLFEASRVVTAVGAFLPLFTFSLAFLLVPSQIGSLTSFDIAAFFLFIAGSVLITWQRDKSFSLKSLGIAFSSAFCFALYFFTIKLVFMTHPFISAVIWSRIGAFLMALFFIFSKEVKEDLTGRSKIAQEKTWLIAIPNQGTAAGAILLQNWAIALAPLAYLGIVNALEGVKYVFLLIGAVILSLKYPQIIREEVSGSTLLQKAGAILLIGLGIALLTFK